MTEPSVVAILIGPLDEGPMERRTEAVAVAGKGLEGDRYFDDGTGEEDHDPACEITLIPMEGIDEGRSKADFPIEPEDMRRNIVTQGVDLLALVGKGFKVGEVELEGMKANPPCRHLEEVTGKALLKPMIDSAGIRARIVTGGAIRVGDPISES